MALTALWFGDCFLFPRTASGVDRAFGGTAPFLAPEACHVLARRDLPRPFMGGSLDVYAFGGVVLQMCSRRDLHTTETTVSFMDRYLRPHSIPRARIEISVSLDSHVGGSLDAYRHRLLSPDAVMERPLCCPCLGSNASEAQGTGEVCPSAGKASPRRMVVCHDST